MNAEELTAEYLALRRKKEQVKRKVDEVVGPINERMAKLEGLMLKHLQDTGQKSAPNDAGTFYKKVRVSATVGDLQAFLDYIKENDLFVLMDVRANKTAVKEFRDNTDDIPPGINWKEELTIGVNKA